MITNLSQFINQNNDNEDNKLTGVVTPYDQKFKRKEKDGFTIFEIIEDETLLNTFSRNVFPDIVKMNNGEIFMSPTKKIIQTLHEYYIKWFLLDKNFHISHDHDYPYVNIPKDGYLMKIVIPKLSEYPDDFEIEYICDINNIQTQIDNSINNITHIDSQNSIDVDTKELLTIENFDPTKYPKIYELLINKKDFFNKYLTFIYE